MSSKLDNREPKCNRCRHHGVIVPLKGHMKRCPFLNCGCWKCNLITQRTRITAIERSLRAESKEQRTDGAGAGSSSNMVVGTYPPAPAPSPVAASTRPLDLRRAAPARVENVAGVMPLSPSDMSPRTAFDTPHFDEFGRPVRIHFPLGMSGPFYPSSYLPYPDFHHNIPLAPPVSAGFYNSSSSSSSILSRPHAFFPLDSGALFYPPLPQPGTLAECKQVFGILQPAALPEVSREEMTAVQQPQPPPSSKEELKDIEQDNTMTSL